MNRKCYFCDRDISNRRIDTKYCSRKCGVLINQLFNYDRYLVSKNVYAKSVQKENYKNRTEKTRLKYNAWQIEYHHRNKDRLNTDRALRQDRADFGELWEIAGLARNLKKEIRKCRNLTQKT